MTVYYKVGSTNSSKVSRRKCSGGSDSESQNVTKTCPQVLISLLGRGRVCIYMHAHTCQPFLMICGKGPLDNSEIQMTKMARRAIQRHQKDARRSQGVTESSGFSLSGLSISIRKTDGLV